MPVRRLRCEQSGFTLIEVLVASTVGCVIMLALFGMADAAQHVSTRIDRRADAAQRGRPAMEQMTQLLRSAVCMKTTTSTTLPVSAGDDNSVTFFAQILGGTSAVGWTNTFNPPQYRLWFDSATSSLKVTTTPNTGSYTGTFTPNAGAATTRTIVTGVRQTGTQPVFRFYAYDASGNLDPYNGTPALPTTAPGLSATDLPTVAAVRLTFSVRAIGKGTQVADSDSSFDEIVRLRLVDPTSATPQNGAVCRY